MPYRVRKVDADIIVLPAKYLPHVRQIPHTKLSLLDAQFDVSFTTPILLFVLKLTFGRVFVASIPVF